LKKLRYVFFEKDFLVRASEAAGATVLQSLLLFLRLKFVAIAAGASGVGVLALGQAHQNIFVGLSNLSSGNVFTRDISKVRSRNEEKKLLSLCLSMGFINGLVMGAAGAALWFVFYKDFNAMTAWVVAIFTSVVALANFNQTVYALRGLSLTRSILSLNLRIFLLGLSFFLILHFLGLKVVWLFFMVIPLASLIGIIVTTRVRAMYFEALGSNTVIELFTYLRRNKIAYLFIGSLVVTASQLIYRWIVSAKFGLDALGYFQTAWMVSSVIMVINTSIMTSVYLPSLGDKDKHSQAWASVRQVLLNFAVLCLVACAFVLFGSELITALSSKDLMPALDILYILFIADALRCIVSTLGLLSFYYKDLIAFLGIDVIGAVFPVLIVASLEFANISEAVLLSYVSAGLMALAFVVYRLKTFEGRPLDVEI
jgi:PST family polysaccharide transporter